MSIKTLLVQDDPAERVLFRSIVHAGMEPFQCRTVTEARNRCRVTPFSIAVVDLQRDAVEALEFSKWFRRQNPNGFLIIGIDEDMLAGFNTLLEAGADDLWPRPYNQKLIQARVGVVKLELDRRRDQAATVSALSTRAQQQVAIAALGQLALSEDLTTVTDLMATFIAQTLGVDYSAILEMAEDGQSLLFRAGLGWKAGFLGQVMPMPPAGSMTGRAIMSREGVRVENLAAEEQFVEGDFLSAHSIVSGLSVPIQGKSGTLGVLGAFGQHPREFSQDDLYYLQGLANVLGAAMERQRSDAELLRRQAQVQHLQRLETVGQIAASLAHDYNNVLTIVQGHVSLVMGDSGLPPKLMGSLKTALDAIGRASNLTRQLLTFSRKHTWQPELLDLNSVVENVAKLVDRVLGRNISLNLQLGKNVPATYADVGMLEQVLMNLAVNARDAMANGGQLGIGTDRVELDDTASKRHPDARAGTFAQLRVTDSGCGMDEVTQRRIFEPFFTTKGPEKGTGLGLATVFGIVKQHQGWIEVESAVGKGSSFIIFIPALPDESPKPSETASLTVSPKPSSVVFLVEDEEKLRQSARLALEELGYKVIEAISGVDALRVWEAHKEKVSVLLTDLVMPDGISGFELAQRLRGQQPDLKVLFASAFSTGGMLKDIPHQRGSGFLQKPYTKEKLSVAIQKCLANPS